MANQVLLIEDDTRLGAMVSDYLGDAGLSVSHATTGTEGLKLEAGGAFDVLILDLMLPDMDGL